MAARRCKSAYPIVSRRDCTQELSSRGKAERSAAHLLCGFWTSQLAISSIAGGAPSGLVPSVLREYGELTRAAMTAYLPAREPRRYLYDLVSDYPLRGGKMMRPSLCIAAARLFGARPEEAICTAVAIELLHNALLIHDDIEDGSEQRRG